MIPTAPRLFVQGLVASAGKKRMNKSGGGLFDMLELSNTEFNFPLTRPTLLKVEYRRTILRYLRLEEVQFKELLQLRQKFVKPTASQILLVRTQHYQGEEHPAARKAVLSFSAADIPLASPAEHHKFRLIAGSRWDSDADTIKISCELFPTVKMNEKWCSDVLDKMVSEARDQTDSMADIPLDTRPTDSRTKKSGSKRIITLKDFPSEWLAAPTPAAV